MLQVLEELSLLSVTAIVATIVLAAVAVYALVQWLPARRRNMGRALADVRTEHVSANRGAMPSTDTLPNPRTAAKVRVGREGNRLSEDQQFAKLRLVAEVAFEVWGGEASSSPRYTAASGT